MDEFLEKLQTTFDPLPPALISENYLVLFAKKNTEFKVVFNFHLLSTLPSDTLACQMGWGHGLEARTMKSWGLQFVCQSLILLNLHVEAHVDPGLVWLDE